MTEVRANVTLLAAALRHERTPWVARVVVLAVLAYAVSPIDLIPDFIPVLGLLDDAVLIPLGLALAIRLVPAEVLNECRSDSGAPPRITGPIGLVLIIGAWVAWATIGIAAIQRIF